MRAHDRYQQIKEELMVAVLQEPGKEPVQVDLQEGYTHSDTSKSKTTETPNDPS